MTVKTANVLAVVEPDIKKQAENILAQLGVPVSVLITMLYKQIILTRSIPFSISLPSRPLSLDEMDDRTIEAMVMWGYEQAKANPSLSAEEVLAQLHQKLAQ